MAWAPASGRATGSAESIRRTGFDVVILANNHLRDHGEAGVLSTLEACSNAGIRTVGAGRTLDEAERPLVIDGKGLRVGVIAGCENEYSAATTLRAGANPIDPIRLQQQIAAPAEI